jgi:phosphatidylinositol alpha-mannosyltransferase
LLPSLAYWTIWATPATPHVATFHAFGEHRPAMLRAASRLGALTLYPKIHGAIAVSPAAAEYAASTWSRRIAVIPNGVSTHLFSPKPNTASSSLRLLFVGRLSDERKGVKYLLDAFSAARERGIDVTLDVVGENHGAPIHSVDGVTFHGRLPLDQLVERYRACDVFVAPSTGQESFGIVLLEAMACGKPIICSDIEGYRSTAAHEGALLVPPRSASALALAIEALASDPMRAFRMGAFNRARSLEYDWASVADRLRDEYLLAIAHSGRCGQPLLEPAVVSGAPESNRPAATVL